MIMTQSYAMHGLGHLESLNTFFRRSVESNNTNAYIAVTYGGMQWWRFGELYWAMADGSRVGQGHGGSFTLFVIANWSNLNYLRNYFKLFLRRRHSVGAHFIYCSTWNAECAQLLELRASRIVTNKIKHHHIFTSTR